MKSISALSAKLLFGLVLLCSTWLYVHSSVEHNYYTANDESACLNEDLNSSDAPSKAAVKPNSVHAKKKKLTLMIYMAGDNNLEPYIDLNRKQIEREGVDPDLHMLLFMCTHRANEPKLATKAIVVDHKTTIVEKLKGLDSGNKDTFIKACQWALEYPADEYAFILWDHGSGPLNKNARRGICYDNTTGNFLTDNDLYQAFSTVSQKFLHGKKLAFLGFDACLMSAIEIASVVKPFANYMISSEHTIPAVGWPYHYIMQSFKQHKNNLATFITHDIVAAYQKYYDRLSQDYTLSCIETNSIDPLIENINAISQTLTELLNAQKNNTVSRALSDASAETTRFDEPAYADLYDWYANIAHKISTMKCIKKEDADRLIPRLTLLTTQGILLLKKAVVGAGQGTMFAQSHGVLIYLPEHYIDKTYLTTQWSNQTGWLSFLRTYLAKHRDNQQL